MRAIRNKFRLHPNTVHAVSLLESNILDRVRERDSIGFLSQYGFGDKHLFSFKDVSQLTEEFGGSLSIRGFPSDLPALFAGEFRIRGASEQEVSDIESFLRELIPLEVGEAHFSSLIHTYAITKRARCERVRSNSPLEDRPNG